MPTALLLSIARLPSASLLVIQLLGLLLYPLMEENPASQLLFTGFGLLVLAAALRMVRRSPSMVWVAWMLAGMVSGLLLLDHFWHKPSLPLMISALEAAFYFYAAYGLIAYMTEDQRATTDELFATGATFTLLAWAFAHLFQTCQLLAPGSFGQARSWLELLYVSFSALSGVGMSDILPERPMARSLVMIEAFVGVMYIALVVSRVIGLTIRRQR